MRKKVTAIAFLRSKIQQPIIPMVAETYNLDHCPHTHPLSFFALQLQELEMENAKLKDDLNRLRKSIADSEPQNNRIQEFMSECWSGFSTFLFF